MPVEAPSGMEDTRALYKVENVSFDYDYNQFWGALKTKAGVVVKFVNYSKCNKIKSI